MCFFFSLMPATILVVIGYFVLFSSGKTEGALRRFGRILAVWVFVVALVPPLTGAYVTLAGLWPVTEIMERIQESE